MTDLDALWHYLSTDILTALAEERLPPPPRTPAFARETLRPRGAW